MSRELSHEEVVDLLGAYALDALEPAELQVVDRHVQGCQACLAEVAEHREVAGLLTPGLGQAPAGAVGPDRPVVGGGAASPGPGADDGRQAGTAAHSHHQRP